jgi:hypothetical protein
MMRWVEHATYMEKMRNTFRDFAQNLKERDHLGNLDTDTDGRTISTRILEVLFFPKRRFRKEQSAPIFGWRWGLVILMTGKKVPERCSSLHPSEKELPERCSGMLSQKYPYILHTVEAGCGLNLSGLVQWQAQVNSHEHLDSINIWNMTSSMKSVTQRILCLSKQSVW